MVLRSGSPELGANVNDTSQFPADVSMRHSHLFVHEFGSARYSVDHTCTLTGEDVAVLMFSAADVHEELSYEGFLASCCHQTLCRVSLPMPHKECPVGHSVIVPASSLTVRRGDGLTISWGVSHTRFLWYDGFHGTSLQINPEPLYPSCSLPRCLELLLSVR